MDPESLELAVCASLGTPEEPSRAAVEAAEVWGLDERAELGHGDFAYSPRELAATYADRTQSRWVMVQAHVDNRCVGVASVQVPHVDNQHMLGVDLRIDPGSDAATVLDGLWTAVSDLLTGEGRTTVIVWLYSRPPGDPLRPRTGAGAVRRTPVTDWLEHRGFELEQVEVASTLEVPAALAHAELLEAEATIRSAGYDLISWVGSTPPALQDAMAGQRARMSTDVPLGEIAMEPEAWDAARVRAEDAVVVAMGRSQVWTIAVERVSGAVVAHTMLTGPENGLTDVAFQDDTLVRTEHRGHRLGLRIKAANLRHLAEQLPRVRRIHTWNAEENDWMLAINRQLGFKPTSTMGCWQFRAQKPRPVGS
ncbi:MAG: hypothetical protein Q4F67_14470 [Propionibacteriaceae bacterium]|nr:hypothetical protein [Propionibacteriaceae bacterium]